MLRLVWALVFLGGAFGWQDPGVPRVSADATLPPDGAVPVRTVSAKGVQIYRCERKNDPGVAGWVFVAPEATLTAGDEQGAEVLGEHRAGPVWRWKDGSAVVGKVLAKQAAPETGAIPWLLLRATAVAGSPTAGQLAGVEYVRRAETRGGVEPQSGCDAAHTGAEVRVPYTAKYTFYRGSR